MQELLDFCKSESQRKAVNALIEHGSNNKAAKALGLTRRTVDKAIARVKGYRNIHHSDGFDVLGKSTLFDADGNIKIEWVKTKQSKQETQQLIDSVLEFCDGYKGMVKLIKPPKAVNKDLLNIIPMGDPHLGMLAWGDETGSENFDCKIAEREMLSAVSQLVSLAPSAETTVLLNLGDFFHSDNHGNTTTKGTPVDVDGRYGKILSLGISIMIRSIELCLQKSQFVIVKNLIGNHDDQTSMALAAALDCFFAKNKRVTVDISPNKFWYYEFGKCLFGATHGDTCKIVDLPQILATDKQKEWGNTDFRYWHTGHVHHDSIKDLRGVQVATYKTLAPRDAWHSAKGYRSLQDMKLITYHKEYGEDSRQIMSIARLRRGMK